MANTASVDLITTYNNDQIEQGTRRGIRALDSLTGAVRTLAGAWGIREAFRFTNDITLMAAAADVATGTFEKLAQKAGVDVPRQMQVMRKATLGTISDLELMQKVGAAVDAGLTFSQATTALQFLRAYSLAFGKDFNHLVTTIFTGLQRGSVQFLDDAGIILSAQSDMFKGMGELEKKTALVDEAIRLMGEKLQNLEVPMDNAIIRAEQLAVNWDRVALAMGRVAQSPVGGALGVVGDALERWADLSERYGFFTATSIVTGAGGALGLAAAEVRESTKASDGFLDRLDDQIARNQATIEKLTEKQRKLDATRRAPLTLKESLPEDVADSHATALSLGFDPKLAEATVDEMLDARRKFFRALDTLEAQAAGNRVAIIMQESTERKKALMEMVRIGKVSAEDEARALIAIEQDKTRQIQEERDRLNAENERRRRQAEQDEIRKILLIFDADTSNVKDNADLAAYSLGLLTEQLRGLSPALDSAISSIQQIVVGRQVRDAATGAISAAGWASIIGGGLGLLSQGIGFFQDRSAAAKAEIDRLTRALEDARDASGQFAASLTGDTRMDLERQFGARIRDLRQVLGPSGTIFGDLDNFAIDIDRTMQTINARLSGADRLRAENLVQEAQRIEEALGRFSGSASTFRQAMDDFSFALDFQGIDDPVQKLAILADELMEIGINIRDGLSQAELETLGLQEGRRLQVVIADLNREIADAEIQARRDQADLIVQAVREQEARVEAALNDAMEAQKRAVLRSVRLQFDLQEAVLRQSYTSRLMGARTDPIETARIIAEAQQEIELLRLAEQASNTRELARIRAVFEEAREQNRDFTQQQIDAINRAADNTSLAFSHALALEIGQQTGSFDAFLNLTSARSTAAITDILGQTRSTFAQSLGMLDTTTREGLAKLAITAPGMNSSDLRTGLHEQTTSLVDAIHRPAWAAGGFNTGSGGVRIEQHFENGSIQVGGGQMTDDQVRELFRLLVPLMTDSLYDGELGQAILRGLGLENGPRIPSTIRV